LTRLARSLAWLLKAAQALAQPIPETRNKQTIPPTPTGPDPLEALLNQLTGSGQTATQQVTGDADIDALFAQLGVDLPTGIGSGTSTGGGDADLEALLNALTNA
jgi:hypothetical protein